MVNNKCPLLVKGSIFQVINVAVDANTIVQDLSMFLPSCTFKIYLIQEKDSSPVSKVFIYNLHTFCRSTPLKDSAKRKRFSSKHIELEFFSNSRII